MAPSANIPANAPTTVIFDLGGVLIDWNPRYLYRKLFPDDETAMEAFLADICTPDWNHQQDAGRPFAEAVAALQADFPDKAELIAAYHTRWVETLGDQIAGTVEILAALRDRGTPLYAITNWSAETFHFAEARFDFLGWFRDIVVSGVERVAKPDPWIFRLLLDRHGLRPDEAVFIDDVERNVAAARAVGLWALRFTEPAALRRGLVGLGLLDR